MPNWKDVLWQQCRKAYHNGGEVKIVFLKRERNKRIPLVYPSTPEPIKCDEETITSEED